MSNQWGTPTPNPFLCKIGHYVRHLVLVLIHIEVGIKAKSGQFKYWPAFPGAELSAQ